MEIVGEWSTAAVRLADRPCPEPGPGEVVLAMRALSINPRDRIMAMGGYGRMGGTLPLVPLSDGAGEVAELGEGVEDLALGDLVCPAFSRSWLDGPCRAGSLSGAHGGPLDGVAQERFAVPAAAVVRAPAHMSAEEAATLPCAAVTAWNAIVEQGRVHAGQRVLVQGTGAVALFALQFARIQGARVLVTSSSDDKLARAATLGADEGLNYRTRPEWAGPAREWAGGEGLDHIVEIGGEGSLAQSLRAVRPGGTVSLIGVLGGAHPQLDLGRVVTRNVRLQGVTVGSREMFARMARAMEDHRIRPVIDAERFAFDRLGAALDTLPLGRHFGKRVCSL